MCDSLLLLKTYRKSLRDEHFFKELNENAYDNYNSESFT